MSVPKNLIQKNYTNGGEFVVELSNKDYTGYYYELAGKLYIGEEYNINALTLIKKEDTNTLLNSDDTFIFSFNSGLTSRKLATPEITNMSEGVSGVKFYCKQINISPTSIKEIDQKTYDSLQGNPLYKTSFVGTYRKLTQDQTTADKQLEGGLNQMTTSNPSGGEYGPDDCTTKEEEQLLESSLTGSLPEALILPQYFFSSELNAPTITLEVPPNTVLAYNPSPTPSLPQNNDFSSPPIINNFSQNNNFPPPPPPPFTINFSQNDSFPPPPPEKKSYTPPPFGTAKMGTWEKLNEVLSELYNKQYKGGKPSGAGNPPSPDAWKRYSSQGKKGINPNIDNTWKSWGATEPESTAWCSSFANWVLLSCGFQTVQQQYTKAEREKLEIWNGRSRSMPYYGKNVGFNPTDWRLWDLVVWRHAEDSTGRGAQGHVGFLKGFTILSGNEPNYTKSAPKFTNIKPNVLIESFGGNQNSTVKSSIYPDATSNLILLAIRRGNWTPPDIPVPPTYTTAARQERDR